MTRTRARRLDKEEQLKLRLVVEDMRARGIPATTIIDTLMLEWGVGRSTVERAIKDVRKRTKERLTEEEPYRMSEYIAQTERVFELALKQGKLSTAVSVMRLQGKVLGLDRLNARQVPASKAAALAASEEADRQAAAAGPVDEFEGRTIEELRTKAETGFWPEELDEDEPAEAPAKKEFPLN